MLSVIHIRSLKYHQLRKHLSSLTFFLSSTNWLKKLLSNIDINLRIIFRVFQNELSAAAGHVNTTLLVHLFGRKGKETLSFEDFFRFVVNVDMLYELFIHTY